MHADLLIRNARTRSSGTEAVDIAVQDGRIAAIGPGLDVRPAAPQARFATLVVAHLKYPFGKDPQPDANLLETGLPAGSETDANPEELPEQ